MRRLLRQSYDPGIMITRAALRTNGLSSNLLSSPALRSILAVHVVASLIGLKCVLMFLHLCWIAAMPYNHKWLASGSDADRRRFVEARGKCRAAVRNAKSEWIGRKANVVESSRFSGKHAWSAIRDIQKCYSGLSPISIPSIRDSDGVICSSHEGQEKCWLQHFARLLNIRSTFDATIFDHIGGAA